MTDNRWWRTIAEIAEAITSELGRDDTDAALRTLLDGVNQLPAIAVTGDLDEAVQQPPSTGDLRWDTLLAAAVRYRLHSMDVVAPPWTVKQPLDKFWWPVRINVSREYNDWAHSPAELLRVGIFLDERDFTTA